MEPIVIAFIVLVVANLIIITFFMGAFAMEKFLAFEETPKKPTLTLIQGGQSDLPPIPDFLRD